MFTLSNEQRYFFALPCIENTWEKVVVNPSPYDDFVTVSYLDGMHIRKVILINEDENRDKAKYCEFQVEAELSEDMQMILPKTAKGKAKPFTSSNLLKLTPVGMALHFGHGRVEVLNCTTKKSYYKTSYTGEKPTGFSEFIQWLQQWCDSASAKQQLEIEGFACEKRERNRYKEGDFFRFRLDRSLYGYGRLLMDFNKMRKDEVPFWDIFMGKPLCVGVYHIATEREDVTINELKTLPMLPSTMIMDNVFYYGECTIIGNEPVVYEEVDFPIHYANSIRMGETGVCYQCGRTYIKLLGQKALYDDFRNNGIGWDLEVSLPILSKCIAEGSNQPYWDMNSSYVVDSDLRNPKFSDKLEEIRKQLGIK